MSFGFSFAGDSEDVLDAIDRYIEMSAKHGDASRQKRVRDVIAAELALYPADKVLFVKASGHHQVTTAAGTPETPLHSTYSGNVSISIADYGELVIV